LKERRKITFQLTVFNCWTCRLLNLMWRSVQQLQQVSELSILDFFHLCLVVLKSLVVLEMPEQLESTTGKKSTIKRKRTLSGLQIPTVAVQTPLEQKNIEIEYPSVKEEERRPTKRARSPKKLLQSIETDTPTLIFDQTSYADKTKEELASTPRRSLRCTPLKLEPGTQTLKATSRSTTKRATLVKQEDKTKKTPSSKHVLEFTPKKASPQKSDSSPKKVSPMKLSSPEKSSPKEDKPHAPRIIVRTPEQTLKKGIETPKKEERNKVATQNFSQKSVTSQERVFSSATKRKGKKDR